jgi:uncharacterized iron-regulated membrane protein
MFSKAFLQRIVHRPHALTLRKLLFQVHLWAGIGVGLYIVVISVTGASLVFRSEMQHAMYPDLFPAAEVETSGVHMADVVENMKTAYPEHELVGVAAPNDEQHTFVGYIYRDETYRAVFADAETGKVIGAIPERSLLFWLQNLHFYLLAGTTGLFVNGVGGLFLLLLSVTGLVIWWPGIASWQRSLKIDFRKSWKRVNWDLHNAGGFWTLAFVAMWAATGAYFAFPEEFRTAVSWFSPVTTAPAIASDTSLKGRLPALDLRSFVADAERRVPGARLARVSLPTTDAASVQITMTRGEPVVRDDANYVYFYFDQFSGKLLHQRDLASRTAGDLFMPWLGRIHVGEFGGVGVKVLWLILGMTPALLFVTGVVMWWNRVVLPRMREALSRPSNEPDHATRVMEER